VSPISGYSELQLASRAGVDGTSCCASTWQHRVQEKILSFHAHLHTFPLLAITLHMMSWIRLPIGADILEFNGVVHLVVGGVPVDNEVPVVTSSISKICRLSLRRCS